MQRAQQCSCATRAFEILVRDFAGLDVRTRTTRPFLHSRHARISTGVRYFGTRSTLRTQQHLQQDVSSPANVVFSSQQATIAPGSAGSPAEQDGKKSDVSIKYGVESSVSGPTDNVLTPTIDRVVLPRDLHTSSAPPRPFQRLVIEVPTRSRTASRLERKARRQEARKAEKEEAERQAALLKKRQRRERKAAALIEAAATGGVVAATQAARSETKPAKPAKTAKPETKAASKPAPGSPGRVPATTLGEAEEVVKPEKEQWQIQKAALEAKFGEQAWNPRKRISPDALAGIRTMHAQQPEVYTTAVLAAHFKVSPEAIRRILKSKWQPSEEAVEDRRKRWEKRGERKWTEMVELGIRPPKKWRQMGVGKVGKGETPTWKKGGSRPGERWIEHPETDQFVMASDFAAEAAAEPGLGDRII